MSNWAFYNAVKAWVAQHPIPPPADTGRCPNCDAATTLDEQHACVRYDPPKR